ncbi:MAG: phosphoadenylyl-sulfate reductase [Planctomycetaceae bacterium]|jgi:phosphoadenosine phosphosulfate reductase|nr:phosphoadenylyl-sulfate reductase [Planctomycetaceae bacterium]
MKTATPELLDQIAFWNAQLESAPPERILQWAIDRYAPKLTMATAFGTSGCVILSFLAKLIPQIPVFNIDTGYQFPETLDLLERIQREFGIKIERLSAEQSVEEYEKANGGAVYQTDSNRCCYERKIKVLERIAPQYDAWISGIRRDQSHSRAATQIISWDAKFGLVKIAPLAYWTGEQVWSKIIYEAIPYNVLYDQGYTSIGCAPCTRPTLPGEDERAGRWSGQNKTECGLHPSEMSLTNAQL